MYIKRYKHKFDVFKALGYLPTFKASVVELGSIVPALESENGIFNAIAVLDKSEVSDLYFKREQVSVCKIETKYDSFSVLTYSVVGYDLLDSFQVVLFNITHLKALKFYLGQDKVVFRSSDLYNTLNDEETRVLRRQRALRHGNFSKEAETTSEVEYAADNGYLSSFVENNGSEVWNWLQNSSADFNDSEESLYGFDSEIEDILELLRAEDNSLSSVTEIEAYLPSDSRWDRGKTSKSKYNCKNGVLRETPANMLSNEQLRHNAVVRENFRRFKHSMRSMDKLLTRRVKLGEYEEFFRVLKGSKQSLEQFNDEMALFNQMEAAEAAADEMANWLLVIAENISYTVVELEELLDLLLNEEIMANMSFVTAKDIAEQLNSTERD